MRWGHLIVCLLFTLFAGWQYNDPDPYVWIPVYGFVALAFGFSAFRRPWPKAVLWLGLAPLVLFLAMYIPDFWNWIQMGGPSIVESMKADKPWVEYTREFLGLALCIAGLLWQLKSR